VSHPPALIIHGHFYQPPRENPWTGIVDREPSAAPFHDWNERIHSECYRPNAWARVIDESGSIGDIVNNYALVNFDVGPTLLGWIAAHHRDTLARIVDADRHSRRVRRHGNAIAQGYNHAILPLCDDRDLRTQIRWGLFEFRHRFGRDAEALWLPETACDDRVLGALIDEGLRYAILAPGQAARVKRKDGWRDVSGGRIDPRRPYRYLHRDGSGRSLALFFYDAPVARGIAFDGVLGSSRALLDRVERASGGAGTLVHAATDGESYGHHFKFGDRCLAYALAHEAKRRGLWVTNYGELLDHHPAEIEVEIALGDDGKGSSWSCAHGVGRWSRDCGCHTGGKAGWNQRWRAPLRAAFDYLHDEAAQLFEDQAGDLLDDPWAARDAYIELVVSPSADRAAFVARHARRPLDDAGRVRVLRLLEAQRSSMLMYTSCGWFFSELSGIETLQVMRYAARLVDQLVDLGAPDLSEPLLERLAEAKSNLRPKGHGADIYRSDVLPTRVDDRALAAHLALSGLPLQLPARGEIAGRRYRVTSRRRDKHGRTTLGTMQLELCDLATTYESEFASAALYFGGIDLHCLVREALPPERYESACARLLQALTSGSLMALLRVAQEEFGSSAYTLEHLLPSGRVAVSDALFDDLRGRYFTQYEAMYQEASVALTQFVEHDLPLPEELRVAAQLALAHRFDDEVARAPRDRFVASAYDAARAIAREAERYGCVLRRESACRHFESLLGHLIDRVCAGDTDAPGEGYAARALDLLAAAAELGLSLDVDVMQERLHDALDDGLVASSSLVELATALGLSPELVRAREPS
jgi:hypothetical protein